MKVLHILRSEPDELVRILIDGVSMHQESIETSLYHAEVDYAQLFKDIVNSDQVISWW